MENIDTQNKTNESYEHIISKYNNKLNKLKNKYIHIETNEEFKDLFKGVLIILIRNILEMKNKLELNNNYINLINKISDLNILLDYLENDKQLLNIDLCDVLLRGYINYIYKDYRDYIMNWNIDEIKNISTDDVNSLIDTKNNTISKKSSISNLISDLSSINDISEYLNVIPEISILINNLEENNIIKLFYLLNNINIIIDLYLIKYK